MIEINGKFYNLVDGQGIGKCESCSLLIENECKLNEPAKLKLKDMCWSYDNKIYKEIK